MPSQACKMRTRAYLFISSDQSVEERISLQIGVRQVVLDLLEDVLVFSHL